MCPKNIRACDSNCFLVKGRNVYFYQTTIFAKLPKKYSQLTCFQMEILRDIKSHIFRILRTNAGIVQTEECDGSGSHQNKVKLHLLKWIVSSVIF